MCVFWQVIGEKVAHVYACVCCGQLIHEKVAHAYACVCVLTADWWQGGSCIHSCVCVFWQLIGENVAHAYACVCCGI